MEWLTVLMVGLLVGVIMGQLSVWHWLRKRGYSREDLE